MNPSTSTNVTFVPGKRGALNAVVDGYRYTKNRVCKENVYYRCVEQSTCSTRITLTNGVLSSPLPDLSHPSQEAPIAVLRLNNNFKKLLWDSFYTEERRRTFMLGSIDNVNLLSQCNHLMLVPEV